MKSPGFLLLFDKIICYFKEKDYLCRCNQNLCTMANRISDRMVKAFERFNADLKAFGEETGETFVTHLEENDVELHYGNGTAATQVSCSLAALECILQENRED